MAEALLRFVFPGSLVPGPDADVQGSTELLVLTALSFAMARFDGPKGFQQWAIDTAQTPLADLGIAADPHVAGVFAGMSRRSVFLFYEALQITEDGEEPQR